MTRQELNLAIFEGTADRPLWQPRLEEWVGYNSGRGTLPERFRDRDLLEVYDDLRCSVRYYAHTGWVSYYREGEVEEWEEGCNARDERQLAVALQVPGRLYNLGDHTTNEFTPPPILERYVLPHWQRISRLMTENGRYVHSHWDGNSRTILPFLRESGLHGVEALTPLPMGDMTLEEIKTAVGDIARIEAISELVDDLYGLPD